MKKWLFNRHSNAVPLTFGGYFTRGLVLFFMLLFLYQLWIFLHICWWVKFNPSSSAFMEDRLNIIQEEKPDAELKYQWVDYSKISNNLKQAVIQQLAKNLFLSTKRTPWRKGEEALITVMLENVLSKRRILEIYLNVIEWGNGVFGAEAASRHYYKTSAAKLSGAQAAKLAAMIPNPRFYDAHKSTVYLNHKTATILARMRFSEVP